MGDVIIESTKALALVDRAQIGRTIARLRNTDRVFCIGNGGGYAHAMHFASDLRKIADVDAYSFDNLAELTARVNDDGWCQAWYGWLSSFPMLNQRRDTVFMFSVGGGMDGLSENLPHARWGIVGMKGEFENRIVIPSVDTPVIEGCQSVLAHHIVAGVAA